MHDRASEYVSFRFSRNSETKKIAQSTWLKEKLNGVLLDYFVQEGFRESALEFSQESGISLNRSDNERKLASPYDVKQSGVSGSCIDLYSSVRGYVKGFSSIDNRKQIKLLILKGDISEAIRVIGTYYPTILDADNLLLFKLLRLNLIEMIRNHNSGERNPQAGEGSKGSQVDGSNGDRSEGNDVGDTESEEQFLSRILSFVRENLLSKVTQSMDLLRQLEVTMSLLCFDFDHSKPVAELTELPEALRDLLQFSLRSECYRAVNRAILDWETKSPLDRIYLGNNFEKGCLPSTQLTDDVFDNLEDSDTSDLDIDIEDGPDLVRSIESMIASVPYSSLPISKSSEDVENSNSFVPANSKLEEIARLWLATESIMVLEKFIPSKRYLQVPPEGVTQL